MTNFTTSADRPATSGLHVGALCVMLVDAGRVSYVQLPAAGQVVIGRRATADVRVEDHRASREHARLHIGERLEVEDLQSANGTLVRSQLLTPWTRVPVGLSESIGIGGAILIVQPAELAERRNTGVRRLRERPLSSIVPPGAVVEDDRMRRIYELAGRVALGDVNVLILGESGSGKELLAETIHRCSPRADGPFLALNCAALSEQLLESELFGYERGAFTGAHQSKPGLLESAPGGTVFLDEIGEMTPAMQAKLLRALETKQLLRVGSNKARPIDVRFVSATNRALADEVTRGRFRRDLYFRLNTMTIQVPPLRERRSEIVALAKGFVNALYAGTGHTQPPALPGVTLKALEAYDWPGNVRELKGAMQRALLLCDTQILPEHLALQPLPEPQAAEPIGRAPSAPPTLPVEFQTELAELEHRRIVEALELFSGNQTRAAEHLGMSRRTLLNRLDEYGISRPRKRTPP